MFDLPPTFHLPHSEATPGSAELGQVCINKAMYRNKCSLSHAGVHACQRYDSCHASHSASSSTTVWLSSCDQVPADAPDINPYSTKGDPWGLGGACVNMSSRGESALTNQCSLTFLPKSLFLSQASASSLSTFLWPTLPPCRSPPSLAYCFWRLLFCNFCRVQKNM